MPVGLTAKVRSAQAASLLGRQLQQVGRALGLQVRVVQTDGVAPVVRGIGPALEARDVLAVLRGEAGAPADLAERALQLAGQVLSNSAVRRLRSRAGHGHRRAGGRTCVAEIPGHLRGPGRPARAAVAAHQQPVTARHGGTVIAIDNRRLARIAKLAGAPTSACAGIHGRAARRCGGTRPATVHAARGHPGELAYALEYASTQAEAVHMWQKPHDRARPAGGGAAGADALAAALAGRLRCDHTALALHQFPRW